MLEKLCECGCKEIVSPGKIWKRGHNNRVKNNSKDENTRRLISIAHKGKPSPMKGRHHTAEANERNRQAHLGKKHSTETIKKESARARGRKQNQEWVQRRVNTRLINNISNNKSWHSIRTVEKIKQANIGRKHTDRTKEKDRANARSGKTGWVIYNRRARLEGIKPSSGYPGFFASDLGYFVRSGWEANIARLLNYLQIEFIYEPHMFTLSTGERYLPDFFLTNWKLYLEVKGNYRGNGDDARKATMFANEGFGRIEVIKRATYDEIKKEYSSLVSNWNVRG